MDDHQNKSGKAVPARRLSRFLGLGGTAANIAGSMAINGAKQLASGQRPSLEDLLLTPSNARKLTEQLSKMRGAAMKIGQMISMDSGDFLPREFADILARLRSEATHMPRAQLDQVLTSEWGEGWETKFEHFNYDPIAAASIGQVHRAMLPGDETVAIKVQYPGVKDSIDSDVNNVTSLLKLSGLVPANIDVAPVIEEGRRQLHQEADYLREARYLTRFGEHLANDPHFAVPTYYPDLSTDKILTMSYLPGQPIEAMIAADQDTRDNLAGRLMTLVLRELFEFNVMQTDPNFANYAYAPETDQIILMDFGAGREIAPELSDSYAALMRACLSGDKTQVFAQMMAMGFLPANMPATHLNDILDLIEMSIEPFATDAPFDFGQNTVSTNLRDKAMDLSMNKELWHIPPPETVFIQRKLGGMYLLASRLEARVNTHALMRGFVG